MAVARICSAACASMPATLAVTFTALLWLIHSPSPRNKRWFNASAKQSCHLTGNVEPALTAQKAQKAVKVLKPQASSLKPQASSLKPQASSLKPQASNQKAPKRLAIPAASRLSLGQGRQILMNKKTQSRHHRC
ncbi:hypothetical protein [Comamonas avium]|uniref:Secreted protein n=1 Tax=Comamonas avium TaxID=2762231 RepID=A0ABR8SEW6_9BURK|nr:hypothetical protein [Comamonas avium]MBD7962026.1 hypothetical protein [Comamonas avium]